jgi:hypothetical protein
LHPEPRVFLSTLPYIKLKNILSKYNINYLKIFNAVFIRLVDQVKISLLLKIQWQKHGVVLFESCSQMIMMTPKVDPRAEQGARMWNRDRLRKRVSLIKNLNDKI